MDLSGSLSSRSVFTRLRSGLVAFHGRCRGVLREHGGRSRPLSRLARSPVGPRDYHVSCGSFGFYGRRLELLSSTVGGAERAGAGSFVRRPGGHFRGPRAGRLLRKLRAHTQWTQTLTSPRSRCNAPRLSAHNDHLLPTTRTSTGSAWATDSGSTSSTA